jgi:pimeloyl-ACP methyl ester carboxylesterase/DNA-binding CsgD family transcriptional regulator
MSWRSSGGVAQEFLCVRLPREGDDAAALIVMNVEIGALEDLRRTLEQVHDLTPSEAEVVAHLARGRSIDEIAAVKGTSTNTVRTQVKQAFAKTGTSRQGELIALVLNGPAGWFRLVGEPQGSTRTRTATAHGSPEGSGVLDLEDGRALSYGNYGPESGQPVVACHHLLGSRYDAPGERELLDRLQIRLIVPERPGIGGSTPVEKRSLMGWAQDLGQLVDALGLDRFHVLGLSSGGPHAAACAAHLSDRVIGVGMAASLMPWDDLPAGTPVDLTQRFLVGMARRWPAGVRSLLVRRYRAQLDRPDSALAELISRGNAADASLFDSPDLASLRLRDLQAAARVPPDVFADELVMLFRPWQFSLRDLRVPIQIWHGRLDDFFSCDQAEAMSRGLRDCRVALEEGWGHFFFYREWERLLRELVELGADA